jgi:hypothetical protein
VLNAKYAYYNNAWTLTPRGGLEQREYLDLVNGRAYGSSREGSTLRPQWTGNVDGHYFLGTHDIRFGAGYRRTAHDGKGTQPGDGVRVRFTASGDEAQFYRDANYQNRAEHWSAYLGDTFVRDRLTVNLAVRWDRWNAFSLPSTATANEARPDLLPDLEYAGSGRDVVVWNNIVPRTSVTYALGDARTTVLRGSFSMYSGTLGAGTAAWDNPVATSYLRYPWVDANGDRDVQMSEVDFGNLLRASNVDPDNPAEVGSTPDKYDPDYGANIDYEVILGIEHELIPSLALSAAYTFRRATNLGYQGHSWWYPWLDDSGSLFTAADFTPTTQTVGGYDFTTYHPTDDAWDRVTWGWLMTNTAGYSQTFNGVELSLVKRLSNGWMGRFAFSYNKHTQSVGPEGIVDPTRTPGDTLDDGGDVVDWAGPGTWMNARWQLNANGMYELPAGFEVSANLFARQGYGHPDYAILPHGFLGASWWGVLPDGVGITDQRLPNVWNLDVRAAWRLRVGRVNLTLSSELFNVFNANTLMVQLLDLSSTEYGRIDEILAPRILRLGVRITF